VNSPTRPTDGRQLPATLLAWIITAINVAVWIAMETAGGSTTGRVLVAFGAKVTPLIAQGEYWRLLTANFVHVGATHLLLNSVALLSFGRLTEMAFGHSRFLTIYLISGLAGVTASYLFTPGLSAGASAAIFGCAAALTVFFARNRRLAGAAGRAQLSGMLFILGANVVFGLVAPAIDQWGHLGGLVCGSILGFALAPRLVLVPGPEGEPPGIRKEPSPLFGWLIVPLMLIILGALVVGK
jgi:rhomboid protease GluP